ncbi:MerR family transcriptional regulator [Frondihabitans sp. PAMC 28766]|uniref:MerR family transcriptional regulator n=1 Tax=Frondihabitans sp. PAMC 28766 TaxID=1795630 RepID=UPI00078D98D5|nr:MerR family transcriptional regulator [Frondihabitans sp. PAMC 28766]AMM19764.1 MerR family transcriptional regulator [Frondihabitans sp. PAMC 28766]
MTTTIDSGRLTIGQVSAQTGLSVHTLRFYEQEGLFIGPVARDSAGRRVYDADEVMWLNVCTRLRSSGMPLADIHRYADLAREGEGNELERLELLTGHRERVREQLAEITAALEVIDHKIGIYESHLEAGSAASLWATGGPVCDVP